MQIIIPIFAVIFIVYQRKSFYKYSLVLDDA